MIHKAIHRVLITIALTAMMTNAHSFTALCYGGAAPPGATPPAGFILANPNLIHLSTWTFIDSAIYSWATHDTLWSTVVPSQIVAEWESGSFVPGTIGVYYSFVSSSAPITTPVQLSNDGETTMGFSFWPAGTFVNTDNCEAVALVGGS